MPSQIPPPPPPDHRPPSQSGVWPPLRSDSGQGGSGQTTRQRVALAELALALRDEQLQARVVHYKADLATSPELDAITEGVVANLKLLRMSSRPSAISPPADRGQLEAELIESFTRMLGRMFRAEHIPVIIRQKVAEVSKRFARLFFESELHGKLRSATPEQKSMRYGSQALYTVLARNEAFIKRQLDACEYATPEGRADANEELSRVLANLRDEFLGRTTPELSILVRLLNEVLVMFFSQVLPASVGELAQNVVREAQLADAHLRTGYKISNEAFPRFRRVFERHFLESLVSFAEDELQRRVQDGSYAFRDETMHFVSDPHIFSDICELVCEAIYDFLYSDGFLDLPADWKSRILKTTY